MNTRTWWTTGLALGWHLAAAAPPIVEGTAVYDHDMARAALVQRARAFVTQLAAVRPLLASCPMPATLLASQQSLELAYRDTLRELDLVSDAEFRRWQQPPPPAPVVVTLTPGQCQGLARRLERHQADTEQFLREIGVLRQALKREPVRPPGMPAPEAPPAVEGTPVAEPPPVTDTPPAPPVTGLDGEPSAS